MKKRMLTIGLDCATPKLLFDEWFDDLPNLRELAREGIFGRLKSTIPPITVPAWTSMMTSKDPGQLGFYGFRNRKGYDYEDLYSANSLYVKEKTTWNYLSRNRLESIVFNVPQTYPPKPIRGIMVGCFLTPDKRGEYTYPSKIKEELDLFAGGDYIIDVKDFRTEKKDWLVEEIYHMTKRRFKVVKEFLKGKPWDFFIFVEMGIDRIHHGFWRFMDKNHRLYQKGNRYEGVIKDYYRYVDSEIGEVLSLLDRDTAVMVVSDHGAKGMVGGICINDWLIKKGYLVLKEYPKTPTRLIKDMVKWDKTLAWGEGGYYSRIFLNVKGREPEGVIEKASYEDFRERLKREIEAIPDPRSNSIGTKVFKPEEIYREVKNIPPDLIVYFGNLCWRGAGTVGNSSICIFENDTGPDDANHDEEGIFIMKGLGVKGKLENPLEIYDIAPTILQYFGIEPPFDMIGKSIYRRIDEYPKLHYMV